MNILLTGVKPTGQLHLGNYFGAIKPMVELSRQYDQTYLMIVDYHAITTVPSAAELKSATFDLAVAYLAAGIDPARVTIFKQSDVPEHVELAWIFNCLTTVPYLSRAHAYKDAVAKNKEANVGLFTYPMLMAADILLYGATAVPVGEDQSQHLEITRDVAEKFNRTYGETFKLPKTILQSGVQTVPGIDGQKMSKSYKNTIPLFASDEEIRQAVMSIVTDSGEGLPQNVFGIHKLVRPEAELQVLYDEKRGKYKELKEELIKDLINFISPLRERQAEIVKNKNQVIEVLKNGASRARERAKIKMVEVKGKVGLDL